MCSRMLLYSLPCVWSRILMCSRMLLYVFSCVLVCKCASKPDTRPPKNRDCNVGYYKAGSVCLPCATEYYRSVKESTQSPASQCTKCKSCQLPVGREYESSPCKATQNRVSTQCGITCAPGQFIGSFDVHEFTCLPCKKQCNAGLIYRLSDVGYNYHWCCARKLPAMQNPILNYSNGYYLSGPYFGNETRSKEYLICSTDVTKAAGLISIMADALATGIPAVMISPRVLMANTGILFDLNVYYCTGIITCPSRYGKTSTNIGTCKKCTNCSLVGLNVSRVCSSFEDSLCQGVICGSNMPCNNTMDTKFYCDFTSLSPSCGVYPKDYDSDGQFCLECPEGQTCDRQGQFACKGQCPAFLESRCACKLVFSSKHDTLTWTNPCRCDDQLGYAQCSSCITLNNPGQDNGSRVVTRGSYSSKPSIRLNESRIFSVSVGFTSVF